MIILRHIRRAATRHHRPLWAGSIAVALLALGIGGWRAAADVVPALYLAGARAAQLQQLPTGQLLAGDTSGLRDLEQQVVQVREGVALAVGWARWARRLAPALSWLPLARHELSASAAQVERADSDLRAASALLQASSDLLGAYYDAQALLSVSGAASMPSSVVKSRAERLATAYGRASLEVDNASRAGRRFAVALQPPDVREARARLAEAEASMAAASRVGQGLAEVLVEVADIAGQLQPFVGQLVVDGQGQTPPMADGRDRLAQAQQHATLAIFKARQVADLAAASEETSRLLPRLESLQMVLQGLHSLSRAAGASLAALEPVLKASQGAEGGLLTSGRLLDILDAFALHQGEMDEAISHIQEAQRALAQAQEAEGGEGPTPGLARLQELVDSLHAGLVLVRDLAPLGPELVGADSARRYLVLGHSSDELRATGGFVSSLWLVTFQGGRLADIQYHDSVRVDDWERLELYPKAPPGLEEHMNAWVWLLRDVSWEPDFPTTARSAQDLFRLGQRVDVDGVIAINQWTLLRLLEALGSISSPSGDELNVRNLLPSLEQNTDRYGRAYVDLALQGLLEGLDASASVPSMLRLAAAIHDTLAARDTLVYFDDPELQQVLQRRGWDGGVRQSQGDYLYPVDSNVGWSKVDRNIQRLVSYEVDLGREAPRATLTLGYVNHSGLGSLGCDPQWLNRGTNYSQLKNACYWDFLRVYIPQGARLLSSTPLPLPQYSVAVDTGRGVPGQDTGGISSTYGKAVFSGLSVLPAGERAEITLVYDLPSAVVQRDAEGLRYQLLIQKQPGVPQREVSVELVLPEGYRLASASMPVARLQGQRASFAFRLTEDTVLDVQLTRDAPG